MTEGARRPSRSRRFSPIRLWRSIGRAAGHTWRRSVQVRVVISTLSLSLLVIGVLGIVLTGQLTDRLLDAKLSAARDGMDRARGTVESSLTEADSYTNLESHLASLRAQLTNRDPDAGNASVAAGAFDPVLVVPNASSGAPTEVGPADSVPDALQAFVRENQVAYQFAEIATADGYRGPGLIIGSPTASQVSGLELYLVFPLEAEARSLALMRNTLLIGGSVLAVLLAAISLLVARQVVLPLRSAARIAVRFADGRLDERMVVRGEDDMARLALSFNEMAESLSNQIHQLEEFGNLQRRFTSDVSHELRTPLTTVRMAADLIHDSMADQPTDTADPTLSRASELLVTELDRFEQLLGDLLEISRHDAGVAELSVERFDTRIAARAAVNTVRHLATETGTELVVDEPEQETMIEADPRRVERILRNLLANAIDHGEGKPVVLTLRQNADAVAFTVRDQGIGLRTGEEKLVFNRFWRADPSRVRRSGGSGLGLAISVEDANLHRGKLEAWGEPGNGAVFRLTLPNTRKGRIIASPLPLQPEPAAAEAQQVEPEIESAEPETGDDVPVSAPDEPDPTPPATEVP